MGFTADQLEELDRCGDPSAEDVLLRLGARLDTALLAGYVQAAQDSGVAWGDAYREAVASLLENAKSPTTPAPAVPHEHDT